MTWGLFGVKPLPELELTYYQLALKYKIQVNVNQTTVFVIRGNPFQNIVCNMAAILSWTSIH